MSEKGTPARRRWLVRIPKPKAARMQGMPARLVVRHSDVTGGHNEEHELLPGQEAYEFDVDSEELWAPTSALDCPCFSVLVVFTNTTGSRRQEVYLRPKPLN